MSRGVRYWMKCGLLSLCMAVLMAAFLSPAKAAESLLLFVDGRHVDITPSPLIVNDRTLIPVRGFFEFLGADVEWEPKNQRVTVRSSDGTVQLQIGSREATVNGRTVAMDVPAQLIEERTYVPLRFIAESLGAEVIWAPPDTILVRTNRVAVSRSGSRRDALEKGQQIARIARQYEGAPYVWGGTNPDGFDCSGFTQYVAAQAGIELPRTSAEQAATGVRVNRDQLLPGDLVFFNTFGPASHSGIYLGDGQFIHAENESTGVTISSLDSEYWRDCFLFGTRIVN